jgi:hypothetical protein
VLRAEAGMIRGEVSVPVRGDGGVDRRVVA